MSGETEEQVSGWTVDTLHSHLVRTITLLERSTAQQIDDLRAMLDERYRTQTKAVDAAFLAQRTAMEAAFTAASKAVETALLSAEKAVTKAEGSAEKRFESVNEFRAQLADQQQTFLPRSEADARFAALTEKVDSIGTRQERMDGKSSGLTAGWGYLIGVVSLLAAVVTIAVAVITSTR